MRNTAKIIRIVFSLILGLVTALIFQRSDYFGLIINRIAPTLDPVISLIVLTLLFGLIYYVISFFILTYGVKAIMNVSEKIGQRPPMQIIGGTLGLIVGLVIAYFISRIYEFINLDLVSTVLAIITYFVLGLLGLSIGARLSADTSWLKLGDTSKRSHKTKQAMTKVLDTSAIIDGRIIDLVSTGFIEGEIIIPEFILKELQGIADSSDDLTRTKGRRGLDFVSELQHSSEVLVSISDKDYDDITEVDIKLLRLAKDLKGAVITTDYNLNKVASVQSIKVLNVNDLSNAVKPNALAGEVFTIEIMKRGKEQDQGVGYLQDGTMIVVEHGAKHLNTMQEVEVTSVLQTPAGRMIFAKIKE